MDRLDQLRQAFRFEEWRGQTSLERGIFIRDFFVSPWQVPGWQPIRKTAVPVGDGPRQSAVYLSDRPERSERSIMIDVFECASLRAAREQLLLLLAEFEARGVARELEAVGDVSFSAPGRHAIVFARANLVVVVRRAERDEVPVSEVAAELDRVLVGASRTASTVLPELRALHLHAVDKADDDVWRVEIDVTDPLARPVWVRVVAPGELWMERNGELRVRRSQDAAGAAVTVTAYNENGGSAEIQAVLS